MHGTLLYDINLSEALFQTKFSPFSSCSLFKLTNPHVHHHHHHHHNYGTIQINHHFLCMFCNKSLLCLLVAVILILHARKHCAEIAVQTGMRWRIFFHWVNFSQIVQFLHTVVCFVCSRVKGLCSPVHSVYTWSQTEQSSGSVLWRLQRWKQRLMRRVVYFCYQGAAQLRQTSQMHIVCGVQLLTDVRLVLVWTPTKLSVYSIAGSGSEEWHIISRHNVSLIFFLPKCA